ncbi:class I SAM-dependent methyltransferase [Herbiconiux sp.]|uniref:class I SAM-dependent methyltransferase n=1 Tax=Herbiconiux sp. TaxID=1871186 RepID=UPI0025BB0D9C|nr:class I SAM-dependent methyltransferase [Herbiconiux sp.]
MSRFDDSSTALSFGQAVAAYERGRPGYPDDAVEWILSQAHTDGRLPDVVDLGAGTGKFTASLPERSHSVTAVEPDPQMRERLAALLPTVTAVDGSAERLPLDDASADLITMAQAWHWVDVASASREVARVLRPGGVLALVWNVRDESADWVAQLSRVIGTSIAEEYETVVPPLGAPLERVAHAEFGWTNELDHGGLVAMVASRSYVIAMSDADRDELFARLEELVRTHPDLAGRTTFALPYVTRVTIARVGAE